MKAVVHDVYGPAGVLRVEEVPDPVAAGDQLLVRVHATSVTRSDTAMRAAKPFLSRFLTGLLRPKLGRPGSDFAGVVEAVGQAVAGFAPGDRVFGSTGGFRANAELVLVRASGAVAPMPDGLSFEEAAAVPDGVILASNSLQVVQLECRRLLVYGASGSIGTAGLQLGKHHGAHVTAVCDTRHVELVRSLGADEVVDYTREDWGARGPYDVILDAVGKLSFLRCRRHLAAGGAYLPTDGWGNFFLALPTKWLGSRKVRISLPPRYRKEHVELARQLLAEGRYRPVVDRTYPLEEVVEAARYVETGQKTGNVVLRVR